MNRYKRKLMLKEAFRITVMMLIIAAISAAVFLVSMAMVDTACRADTTEKINIDPSIPDASRIASRLRSRLTDQDDIRVWVAKTDAYPVTRPGDLVVIWAAGDKVTVYGNDWVPQNVVDDILYRTKNVNQNPIDTVMGVIQMVHDYQASHPKPKPPPPPAGPPAPKAPEEPTDWVSVVLWVVGIVGFLTFVLTWVMLHRRMRQRQARARQIAHDAEVQADWGLSDYGIDNDPFSNLK